MVRKSKITSLAELKRRQKQVRMESELAKRELAHSLGTTRTNLQGFVTKKVVAPVGGAGLALFALSKLFGSSGRPPREIVRETKVVHEYPDGRPYDPAMAAVAPKARKSRRSRFKALSVAISVGRLLIPIVQAIIGAVNSHQAKESAEQAEQAAKQASY